MRLQQEKRDVESSAMMEVSQAKVRASRKIFDMFADQVYANKPVAILRETVANGVDAHIAAGCPQRPVEVTLPTDLDPMCMIKDFGIGMPHEFVMGPFMEYTNGSTKDQSDDQIGGFGIGSKSPLSYVDQFTLRVVHGGVLSVYTLFKDEEGIPAIGLQAQTTTDEPNGVEISFPVQGDDVQTFRDAAQDALQYFNPMPVIHNGEIDAPSYTYTGNQWALRHQAGALGVIMGGVRYPVEPNSLEWDLRHDDNLSPLLNYGIDITLPIGAAPVAMSREGLSYTKKTTEAIKAALEGIIDDVVKTFSTFFDTEATEWEAMAKLHAELGGGRYYNRSARQQLMAKNARYKGRELKSEFKLADVDLPDTKTWRIEPSSRRRSANCPTPKWNDGLTDLFGIVPGEIDRIIVDDMEVSPKNKNVARMRHFVDNECDSSLTTIVVRPPHGTAIEEIRKLFRGCPKIELSSKMPEPPKQQRVSNGQTRPKVRMFTFNGASPTWGSRTTNLTPAYGKNGINELEPANQPATGIMVVMNSFEMPDDIHERIATGLFSWSDLVFVNSGDAAKIKDHFTDFEDAWNKKIADKLAQMPDLAHRIAVSNDMELSSYFRNWQAIRDNLPFDQLTNAQKARPFGRIADLYETYVAPLTNEQRLFAPFVTAELPPRLDTEKLVKALKAKQPKLVILLDELVASRKEHVDILKDYL